MRVIRISRIWMVLGMALLASTAHAQSIAGRVVSAASHLPIGQVRVAVFDLNDLTRVFWATTDGDGRFALTPGQDGAGGFELAQNFPNPFNPETVIPYRLGRGGHVRLTVYSVLGQRIRTLVDGVQSAGAHRVRWAARDDAGRGVAAGVYLYRLAVDGTSDTRRLVLLDGRADASIGASVAVETASSDAPRWGITFSGNGIETSADVIAASGVTQTFVVAAPDVRPRAAKQTVCLLGDVNADGAVNISDALIVATYGLDPAIAIPNGGDIAHGDVNADGQINVSDALIIATYGINPTHAALPAGIGQPVACSGAPTAPPGGANQAPVLIYPGVQITPIGLPLEVALTATDADGDALSFSSSDLPAGAVLSGSTLRWTPQDDQVGEYEIAIRVSDGRGGTDQKTLVVEVSDFQFALRRYFIETKLPSFVDFIFQVTDASGRGIDGLTQGHFEVLENNQPLSPSESALRIRPLDAVPHTLKTVLMLDNSASIGDDLAHVKAAAVALVQSIAPNQEFAVYQFSETPELIQDFTSDVGLLTDAIQRIRPGFPTTNLYGSVAQGLLRWRDVFALDGIEQGFLIVLTDGRDTQGVLTLAQVTFDRGQKRIYAVGLGSEVDPKALGELGNAGVFLVPDAQELGDQFARIQADIALSAHGFYWLNYLSPTRGDRVQNLRVVIRNNKRRAVLLEPFNSKGFYSIRKGVHVNATPDNPEGIGALVVSVGDTITLRASTFLGQAIPAYSWQVQHADAATVTPNAIWSDVSEVLLKGAMPDTTVLVVSDTANDMQLALPLSVVRTALDTFVTLPGGAQMEMVYVPAGAFAMGSATGEPDERPVQQVTLSNGFYLGKFEVTQHQWVSVMDTRPWETRDHAVSDSTHPATYVSWEDVQAFIQKLNVAEGRALYRLPTEAEWEYAARAGTNTRWSFGDREADLGDYAWFSGNAWLAGEPYAHPVGVKRPNAWRFFDMYGNAREWVHDWYGPNYTSGATTDPLGPSEGPGHVVRGGCFACTANETRSASRHFEAVDARRHTVGFRLLRLAP